MYRPSAGSLERLQVSATDPDAAVVARAGVTLRRGGLVGLPTETVYGLAANAWDEQAVRRIFEVKGRPPDNPLIVHLASPDQLELVAATITPLAKTLAASFWPGPLTLVLEAQRCLPAVTTGGLSTVAVRVPDHAVARAVIATAGVPVAAPSANRSGRPSPTTAEHVAADLGDRIDLLIDAGPTGLGLESTVVDAKGGTPLVYRDGAITREQLGVVAESAGTQVPSPGTRHRHYAPRCAVQIVQPVDLIARADALADAGVRVGVVAPAQCAVPAALSVATFADAAELARILYAAFRDAEAAGVEVLLCAAVPETGLGRAVMDRLRRAAAAARG